MANKLMAMFEQATGGGSNALNGIDGLDRGDGNPIQLDDYAYVANNGFYRYILSAASDNGETYIKPLTNPVSGKIWELQQIISVRVGTGGIFCNSTVGSGFGRPDAQLEIQNSGGSGHALMSIFNTNFPPNLTEEPAISFQAYTTTGSINQQASISTLWAIMDSMSVLRIQNHGDYFRLFGPDGGATLFNQDANGDYQNPGARVFVIYRSSSKPSIVGDNDIVIDANYGGSADNVFLNAYNAGNVISCLGGGSFGVGTAPADFFDIYKSTGTSTDKIFSVYSDVGGSNTLNAYIQADGNIYNTNGTYGTISDRRFKENITQARDGYLDEFMDVEFCNYNLIGNDEKLFGTIAQDIEKIWPGLVETLPEKTEKLDDDGNVTKEGRPEQKFFKSSIFNMIHAKVTQEHIEKTNNLEKRIKYLENKVEELIQKISDDS